MRLILRLALCGCLAAGLGLAQRGGGHGGGGGGFSGGGIRVGGHGFYGGGIPTNRNSTGGGYLGGAYHGSGGGTYHNGWGGGYYHGGYYGYRGYYGYYGWGWPYWYYPFGFGYSYWPGYYDYSYDDGYSSPSYTYPAYQPASNVTVMYPQTAQSAPRSIYVNPSLRQYDEYGQELAQPSGGGSGAPIYLIAFRDQSMRAAVAYWVEGRTLHYVTPQYEEKQTSLDSVDRDSSMRVNRERRVPFSLPEQ